jgi:hypothetical protein
MTGETNTTTDHDSIRAWVEARGGSPARVTTDEDEGDEPGLLRVALPEAPAEEPLETISWDDFFRIFEESELAFVCSETQEGEERLAYRFVPRVSEEPAEEEAPPTILDLLRQDHQDILTGLSRLMRTTRASEEEKLEMFEQLRTQIELHARLEEELIYPALGGLSSRGRALAEDALDAHREIDSALAEIAELDPDDLEFADGLSDMQDALAEHVEEEETKLFAEAEARIEPARLESLAEEMRALREEWSGGGTLWTGSRVEDDLGA